MDIIRRISKPAAAVLSIYMLVLAGPFQSVHAALISTESLLNDAKNQRARNYINDLLSRRYIQAELISHGIDPHEAKTRIESLSDAEIKVIVDRLEQLPAGGFFETLLIIGFLVFVILIITDITGATDVFPFVSKSTSRNVDRHPSIKDTGESAARESNAEKADSASLKAKQAKPDQNMTIYFEQDSNELSDQAIETLNKAHDILRKNPDSEVTILGYPNSQGSSSYNKMLAENRVYTVKMYLLGKGLDPSQTKLVLDDKQMASAVDSVGLKIRFQH